MEKKLYYSKKKLHVKIESMAKLNLIRWLILMTFIVITYGECNVLV
ncbi:MAG: hypothetical protein HXO08_04225 [Prevotella salivae]|nr:hypothetical protein [Segatella salivae]